MRLKLFLFLFSLALSQDEDCQPGCFCDEKKGEENKVGLRVHCIPGSFKLDFTLLHPSTLHLDLSKYGLTNVELDFFSKLRYLEKLDLQKNQISRIQENSFKELNNLLVLDLSENLLTHIHTSIFIGLKRLTRLKLNDNRIQTIEPGAFNPLTSITKIDLMNNPFDCDCRLSWILEWKDTALNKARCGGPPNLANTLIKTTNKNLMVCSGSREQSEEMSSTSRSIKQNLFFNSNHQAVQLDLNPGAPQLVVEGDPFRLSCTLSQSKEEAILSWSVNGNAVSGPEVLVSQINPVLEEAGGTHSSIYIRSVGMDYAGKWSCRALLQSGYSEERSVLVQIMSPGTILCPWSTTKSSKGVYNWPVTLAGQSSTLDCTKGEETTSKIVHFCDDEGHWTGLNESECRHTNDVTDKLSRFSTMNHSRFDPVTLDQAAEKLLEFTSNPDIFLDSQDIVYLTKSVENYLNYLKDNPRLADILVRIVRNILDMKVELVLAGQIKEQAGARLVNSINSIARIVTGFQCGVPGLVVQGVPVSQRNFLKLTCSWPSSDTHPDRAVDCSEKNISFSSGTFGSIQLPSSLPYQLAQLDRELSVMKTVVISGFNSDTLFPQVGVISGVVSSSILGATIPNIEPFDLKEPVHVMLRRVKAGAGQLKPVWWDTSANKGLGGWSSHHCTTKEERNDGILFTCSHLGYYTLILQSVDGVSETATPLAEYLSVYLGSILGLISISLTVFIYSLFSSSILLSSSYKQALVNLWLSIILFLVFYCISGEMEEQVYCALTGMLLHYTTLTSFFWLALTSAVIHSKVTGPEAQQEEMENVYGEIANRDESMGRIVVRKSSISKYYLIGWCVPLFICGITAGASFNQYTSQGTCYLSLEVSAGSILAPVLVSLSVYTYYTVHMYTCRSSTRVFVSKKNEGSNDETHLPLDQEKSIRMHGSVQCLFTFLLVCLFTTAGVRSLLSPTLGKVSLRLVCSVLFCALSLSIGVLVLSFYVFSRKDLMMKFTKRESSDRREETTNLLSPHQLRYSPARFQQNIFNPGTVGTAPPFSNMAAAGDINKMAENKQQNTFLKLTGQFMNNKSEAEPYDVFSVKNTGGSVIGYIAPNNSAGPSDLDCLQVSEFGYKPKVKNVNLLVDREKSIGKSVWNQENLEMMAMDNRWEEVEELDEEEDRWSRADQRNPDQDLDYFFNQNQSELSPSLPPPIFSPSPFPGSSTGIVLDSQYNLGERHPSSRDPFPTSLPNKRRSKSRDRSGFLKSGVSDLDRTDVASRYSEVSSSMYSTRSKKRSRDKPRRKPRKRSEILQSGSRQQKAEVRSSRTEEDPEPSLDASFQSENGKPAVRYTSTPETRPLPTAGRPPQHLPDPGQLMDSSSENIHLSQSELGSRETCV